MPYFTEMTKRHQYGTPNMPQILMICGIFLLAWFYAPSWHFGFIWDDPQWFGRIVGKGWLELIRPLPDFQFYRPGTLLYHRLFLRADGTFATLPLHMAQVGWHLLNVALFYALGARLGLGRWFSAVAALLFGVQPYTYQAVAWASPQHTIATSFQLAAWLLYLQARQGRRRQLALSLLLFGVACTIQEGSMPLAFLPLLLERLLTADWRDWWQSIWRGAGRVGWVYVLLAGAYGFYWLQTPRLSGITGLLLEADVARYVLQGIIYPLTGRPLVVAPEWLFAVGGVGVLALLALAQRQGRGVLALVALAWTFLGVIPVLVGLSFDYVALGARLLYFAAPAISWLWVAALWPAATLQLNWRWGGALLLALIALQSGWLLAQFQRLYLPGTNHMREMLTALDGQNGRFLFINFPDRYTAKEAPYALGYWGITLAPVVMDLRDFVAIERGSTPTTTSYSLPWIDLHEREQGPFLVDMRGVIISPEELYQAARGQDGVYLSRYRADGRFRLQWVGSLHHMPDNYLPAELVCKLAVYDSVICLQAIEVQPTTTKWQVTLSWMRLTDAEISPFMAPFVHLGQPGQPPIAQDDGDAWFNMLPTAVWQPGDLIHDARALSRVPADDALSVQVGLYNWVTGERAVALAADGQRPLANNAYSHPLRP